ncbi:MAG: hypothetical protein ACJ8ER_12970 [Allosphingosinicella sp.]
MEQGPSVMEGWLYGILRTGPYRGHMVVGEQPRHRGGAASPASVVSPSGEVIMGIPGSDKDGGLALWLKEKGWLL